jgi:hypothetical protein
VTTSGPDYLAYLLRLWRVGKKDEAAWRASLEDAHTGERQGFADLTTLLAFLEAATERSGRRQESADAGCRDEGNGGAPIGEPPPGPDLTGL